MNLKKILFLEEKYIIAVKYSSAVSITQNPATFSILFVTSPPSAIKNNLNSNHSSIIKIAKY